MPTPPVGAISHSAVALEAAFLQSRSVVPSPLRSPLAMDVPSLRPAACRASLTPPSGDISHSAVAARGRLLPHQVGGAVAVEIAAGDDAPALGQRRAGRSFRYRHWATSAIRRSQPVVA